MKLRTFLLIWGATTVIIALAVAASLFLMVDPWNLRAPSDEHLLKVFHDHRSDFERLRVMSSEDSSHLAYITSSSVTESSLGKLRQQEYQKLLNRVCQGLVELVGDDTLVKFSFAAGGLLAVDSSWLEGIEYVSPSHRAFEKILPSLDNAREAPPGVYLRHIEGNWFIFYEQD